jgi:rhodanese-related sulfurtransferase
MTSIVDRAELQARLASATPPILVEALPEKYFAAGHLPGAIHLPHDAVAELAPRRLPDREAAIVVYCANRNCQNSHIAARRLAQMGYRRVAVYAAGKQDWQEAGLPLEEGVRVAA